MEKRSMLSGKLFPCRWILTRVELASYEVETVGCINRDFDLVPVGTLKLILERRSGQLKVPLTSLCKNSISWLERLDSNNGRSRRDETTGSGTSEYL